MKIVAIVGSPRKKGNTDILVDYVIKGAQKFGAIVHKIYLSDYKIQHCMACEKCAKSFHCVIHDDMQKIYSLMEESDGIILGSPTYFYNVSGLMKNFIDRLYCYDFFDETDRSVWIGRQELFGPRYAVTVAVCEQETIEDMGCTADIMNKSLQAIGYRVVNTIKGLHVFKKGEINQQKNICLTAELAGEKLGKTILLVETIRQNSSTNK